MRGIERVRHQIMLGIGSYLAMATAVACGGRESDPGAGTGGATQGVGGTSGGTSGSGGTAGAAGEAGAGVMTGGAGGATIGVGGSGGSVMTGGAGGASGSTGGSDSTTSGGPGGTGGAGGSCGSGGAASNSTGGAGGWTGGTTVGAGGTGGCDNTGGTGGSGGATGGSGGTAFPEAGSPRCPSAPWEAPICSRTPGSFYDDKVCLSEGALEPYRIMKLDPNRALCGLSCPVAFDLTTMNFCGGRITFAIATESDNRCCYPVESGPVDGRPFRVAGESRQAGVEPRRDWCAGLAPSPQSLEPATRARIARAWLIDARAEHASIATFARLSLELLSLGAPPELIADAHRAGLDEIEHARLCFGLASAYADGACGPGRLSTNRAVRDISLVELAVAAVREGCVGETIAAVLAGSRLERASDPGVRAALTTIADDEARHAALAWRTVVWAIERGGSGVANAVHSAFAHALAPYLADVSPIAERDVNDDALQAHGCWSAGTSRSIERRVARDVILPLAAAIHSRQSIAISESRERSQPEAPSARG